MFLFIFKKRFYGYVNELIGEYGFPESMKKEEMIAKSNTNLRLIHSSHDIFSVVEPN